MIIIIYMFKKIIQIKEKPEKDRKGLHFVDVIVIDEFTGQTISSLFPIFKNTLWL